MSIKIINNDCIEAMQSLNYESIDLVVTSPPYNIGIEYNNYNDNIDWSVYYGWCKEWLWQIYKLLKDDGRACIIHYLSCGQSNNRHAPLMKINSLSEEIGFKHHGLAVWWDITLTKRTAWGSWLSSSSPYVNSPFEGILILYKKRWKKDKEGKTEISKEEFMESCSGIWKIPTERNRIHPAPFPVALSDRCIKLLSYEGDTVLDPFMGWGTTLVSCKKLNRNGIGIELSPKYCELAEQRLMNMEKEIDFSQKNT